MNLASSDIFSPGLGNIVLQAISEPARESAVKQGFV
jgi:hypothetical protein